MPSYAENTDALDQYLQDIDDDDEDLPTVQADALQFHDTALLPPRRDELGSLKRKQSPQVFDEIIVQRPPKRRSSDRSLCDVVWNQTVKHYASPNQGFEGETSR
jgi:hypothetical protein